MDQDKVGKLILELRKGKGLTQKQLAQTLNLSDRTVSKWERGLGCPDVSLLHDLSEVLDVNIDRILMGDLDQNSNDTGNISRIKFYVCPLCGNILTATNKIEVSCCGRKLKALIPKLCDENHKILIETVENDYYITFYHEMNKRHYVNFVAYVNLGRFLFIRLYPEQANEVRFPKYYKGKLYFGCNQHGLWVND